MLIKQLIEETCSCSCGGLPVLEYDTEGRMYRVVCEFLEDGTKEGVHLKTRFFPNSTDAIRDWETFVGKRTESSDVKDSIDITDSVTRIKGDSLIVHDCTVCHKKPRFFKSPGKDKWYQVRCCLTHSNWMPSLSTAIADWNAMCKQNETKKEEGTKTMEQEEQDNPEYKPLDIPELGISFKRFYSDKIEKFIAAWKNEDCSHVYEVVLRPLPLGTGWTAEGLNDGHNIFTITTSGKWRLRQMALAAMKASLIYTHRRTWKKVRKEKKVSKTSTEK